MKGRTGLYGIIGGIITFLILITLLGGIVFIPAGHVGVVTQFGAVTGRTLESGMNFKMPLLQGVVGYTVKTQIYEANELTAASKDLQDVNTNIAINYRLDPSKAAEVYATIGKSYMEIIAHPAVQEIVKEITAKYNAEECITKRTEVKEAISVALINRLGERGIIVENVNITNFEFSPDFTAAIEAKVSAQQKIETAKNDLERIRVEAEQARVAAQGKSDANDILAQSLTPEILAYLLYTSQNNLIVVPNDFTGGLVVNP